MFSNLMTVLLQAAPGGSPMISLLMMGGMVVVMYFFMIRPQAKRAKEQKKFGEGINVGEKIITTAGIHGTIRNVNTDGSLKIEVSANQYLTIERSAVSMEMTQAFRKKTESAAAPVTN